LRVTINGQRFVASVNLKVNPKNWNAVAGKSIANTRMDDELNARLDTIRLRIMQIYREMELDRESISAQKVVLKVLLFPEYLVIQGVFFMSEFIT
jgi:predicted fused transcriptional regulator/phosphomethylpyrimidine kinase